MVSEQRQGAEIQEDIPSVFFEKSKTPIKWSNFDISWVEKEYSDNYDKIVSWEWDNLAVWKYVVLNPDQVNVKSQWPIVESKSQIQPANNWLAQINNTQEEQEVEWSANVSKNRYSSIDSVLKDYAGKELYDHKYKIRIWNDDQAIYAENIDWPRWTQIGRQSLVSLQDFNDLLKHQEEYKAEYEEAMQKDKELSEQEKERQKEEERKNKPIMDYVNTIENKSLKARAENDLKEKTRWKLDDWRIVNWSKGEYISYLVNDLWFTPKEFPTWKTYPNWEPKVEYMIVNEKNVGYKSNKIENAYARSLLEKPTESKVEWLANMKRLWNESDYTQDNILREWDWEVQWEIKKWDKSIIYDIQNDWNVFIDEYSIRPFIKDKDWLPWLVAKLENSMEERWLKDLYIEMDIEYEIHDYEPKEDEHYTESEEWKNFVNELEELWFDKDADYGDVIKFYKDISWSSLILDEHAGEQPLFSKERLEQDRQRYEIDKYYQRWLANLSYDQRKEMATRDAEVESARGIEEWQRAMLSEQEKAQDYFDSKEWEIERTKVDMDKISNSDNLWWMDSEQIKEFAVQQWLAEISKPQTKEYTVDKWKVKENF